MKKKGKEKETHTILYEANNRSFNFDLSNMNMTERPLKFSLSSFQTVTDENRVLNLP